MTRSVFLVLGSTFVIGCGDDRDARDTSTTEVTDVIAADVEDAAPDVGDTLAEVDDDVAPDVLESTDTTDTTSEVEDDAAVDTVEGVEATIVFPDLGRATDLTPDGALALFQDIASATNEFWFYDTRTGTATKQGETGDFERPVMALSAGGERVVGFHGEPIQASYWTASNGWRHLGSVHEEGCDLGTSSAFDVSADGHTIVGLVWNGCAAEPFVWSDADGSGEMVLLDPLGNGSGRATEVSDDGRVIGGFAAAEGGYPDRMPAVWKADGTGVLLDPTQEVVGEVLSVSADGSRVAGLWYNGAFTWTEATGVVQLGLVPGAMPLDMTYANAIAADGQLIFGGAGDAWAGSIHAFVWTEKHGMRLLDEVAAAAGVELPEGYWLGNVFAASNDGTILLGSAIEFPVDAAFPTEHSFVMTLPVSAYDL